MTKEFRIDSLYKIDSKAEKLTNGFLRVDAYLTRCGVFAYQDEAGNVVNELRHPDDVYEEESLKTLQSLPLTHEHPDELVTAENCSKYQVGYSDSWLKHDDGKLGAQTTWTDKDVISIIESGAKRDMSCGYLCDVIDESGEWMGIAYQKRQKNIRYNHGALTEFGRAGKDVGIRMDSKSSDGQKIKIAFLKKDSCRSENPKLELSLNSENGDQKMKKKIKIDSVDVEVDESIANHVENLEKDKSALEGEKQVLSAEVEKQKTENEELKSQLSDDAVLQKADSLLSVKNFAEKVLEKVDGLKISEMKTQVVAKVTGTDVSKKDSAYIDAAFETIRSLKKDEKKIDASTQSVVDTVVGGNVTVEKSKEEKNKAHADSLQNAWKKTIGIQK